MVLSPTWLSSLSRHSLKYADGLIGEGESTLKEILFGKQVFPYEYLNDVGKLNEKNLPPRAFYTSLKGVGMEEEYSHAKRVLEKAR